MSVVHDSVILERVEACDNCCAPRYHWIEDGTYEDFKRNILESDLPVAMFEFASTGYALMGTFTGRMAVDPPQGLGGREIILDTVAGMALMGTHAVYMPGDVVNYQGQHWVHTDHARVEQSVLAMLLARPEMQHEPQAATP